MNNVLNIEISTKIFNEAYLKFLDDESRFLVFYGGGSSGKSHFIVQRYIYKSLKQKMNLIVVRKTAKTNRDSTFALFKQIIKQWNMSSIFRVYESSLRIKNLINGNEIIFEGLDDVEKLKSVTFENGEATDVWVEEATECLESDINQLNIRLRGGKSKKQMILSFNPVDINHWIKKKYIDSGTATVLHTTHKDNKFLSDEDRLVLESFKETDPYYYNVYCLGMWGVLGKTIFDAEKVSKRLAEIKKPIKVGFFVYDYDGLKITNIRWVTDPNGYINIYDVPKTYKYAIGGDTAGEGSDYFTAQVINNQTGQQVATLRCQMDEDLYAKQMYCLGMYYKEALIGIEANFSTYPIKELERLGYKNQYVREKEDDITHKIIKAFGFKTTMITRPIIIANLVALVREHTEIFNDKWTLEEMLTFIRNTKGRPEAQEGAHDDLIMALAIAHYIRSQISTYQEPIIPEFINEFNVTFNNADDFGEKLIVV